MADTGISADKRGLIAAFITGTGIATLAGLIGLGGSEYRLPFLIRLFRFGALEAVIVNEVMSLFVVTTALPFRAHSIPLEAVAAQWPVIVNLLGGSLLGAWLGASWATRLRSEVFSRIIAVLLAAIAAILMTHGSGHGGHPLFEGYVLIIVGLAAGFGIGIVAALLGVAGGELLVPTLILLFGIDVKLAGSLSLAVSVPTMAVGFARYSRDRTFPVLVRNGRFVAAMAVGSVVGSFIGARLLGIVPISVMIPILSVVLLISAASLWLQRRT